MTGSYVEMLRVRRALIVYAVVLAVAAITAIVSILLSHSINVDVDTNGEHQYRIGQKTIVHRHGSVTKSDTIRIEHHVIISGDPVTVTDSSGERNHESKPPSGQAVRGATSGRGRHGNPDLGAIVLLSAGMLGAIFATFCAGAVSAENRGHLPLAWTKPASRERYLGRMFAIDAAGIVAAVAVAAILVTSIVAVAGVHFVGWTASRSFLSNTAWSAWPADAVVSVLFPLAWYALIVALTASLRERASAVMVLVWPVALGVAGGEHVPISVVHVLLHAVNIVNPLTYYNYTSDDSSRDAALFTAATASHALPLLAIAVAGAAIATWEWRRLEM